MANNHLPKNNQCVKNWEIALGKDCAVLPGVVTTAARGNPFPMPLAIVTKSKMHQGMNKSNAQKQTNRQTHRKCSWGTVPVQVTCRQTLYTKTIILRHIENKLLCDCFKHLLNWNHFSQHQLDVENKVLKHLKVHELMRWWWNFTCVYTISLNFEIYSLKILKIVFGITTGKYLQL